MATAIKMVPKVRKRLNDRIHDVSSNVYFDTIGEGLSAIDNVLCGHEFERKDVFTVDNESGGRFTFDLLFDELDVTNSFLIFCWFRMRSGRYEIVAYVS